MSEIYGTFSKAYVEAMRLRLSALEPENKRLAARVAELEARTREAEESNANAQARLSAAEATIESRRVENEAVRRQLGRAENACDAMEKRVAELETMESRPAEKATPCPYCLRVECECSDFDVMPDMGDK